MKTKKKNKNARHDHCKECRTQADCCKFGAWIDLEEAKEIVSRGIKGDFFHLEKDADYPSGFRVGTSYEDNSCSFLGADGLCSIHKVDYSLKPVTCREFPYEKDKISPFADVLCTVIKNKKPEKRKKR